MRRRWNPKERNLQYRGFDTDIRTNLEKEQMQNYAACCLTWNRIENAINVCFCVAIGAPPHLRLAISSRMSGIESKIDTIYDSLSKHIAVDEPSYLTFTESLGAIKGYKKLRDGIVHAYIANPTGTTAITTPQKGKLDETLVTKEALDTLYQHLMVAYEEISFVVQAVMQLEPIARTGKPDGRKQIGVIAPIHAAQLREIQKLRRSLPQLPKFPDEPPTDPVSAESSTRQS